MAKGFKLKELLTHQKEISKQDRLEAEKKLAKESKIEKETPTVITQADIDSAAATVAAAKKNSVKVLKEKELSATEEYKSNALSKKEKRKLKKELKKQEQEKKGEEEEENENENDDEEEEKGLDLNKLEQSDSESEEEEDDDDEKEEDDEEEEDVPLSEVEFDSDADIVPHSKLTVNNAKAIKHALERIQLPWSKHSFQEHQSVISSDNTDSTIKDIYDDTERELAFYKQSLDAVMKAREELKRLKVPFLRPLDYFAEMVKSDEHMDKIKGKLITEVSEKKAREEARKQRQLKKFGKQVQVATLQKRQLEKRETLDKIKDLKKKRKQNEINENDFDVGVEEAAYNEHEDDDNRWKRHKPSAKRASKNSKYGQGGMKRFKRKNDADSAADVSGFSNKSKSRSRPGKSRRSRRY